ncbi:MAG: AMP-binding protein, partial [Gemmatimonadales bacterium]
MSDFVWSPPPEFARETNIARFMAEHGIEDPQALLQRSVDDQAWFWNAVVEDLGIEFAEPYHTVVDASRGNAWAEWFVGGRLNITANCLERHAWSSHADRVCLISEREDGTVIQLTFRELFMQVEQCAAALASIGIDRGDRVAAYMPMTQDVVIQLLATLKLGAIFIPIFKGFQPDATAARLRDADARVLFTADGSYWRGDTVPIKGNIDAALTEVEGIEHVVVARYTDDDIVWNLDRDIAWPDFLNRGNAVPTRMMNAMDPALILYTSGTSGLPKGTVHSHAGSLVQIAKETGYAFDLKPSDRLFWLTDMAWVMGPWSLIGGLFHGATVVLYDGVFDYPR